MRVGRAGSGFNLGVTGVRATVADIFLDTAKEQRRALRDERVATAQVCRIELVDGLAIDADTPLLRIVEAQQEIEQGGLSGTGWTDQRQGFTGLDTQVDAIDGPLLRARGVGKAHGLQLDATADSLRQPRQIGSGRQDIATRL